VYDFVYRFVFATLASRFNDEDNDVRVTSCWSPWFSSRLSNSVEGFLLRLSENVLTREPSVKFNESKTANYTENPSTAPARGHRYRLNAVTTFRETATKAKYRANCTWNAWKCLQPLCLRLPPPVYCSLEKTVNPVRRKL